MPPTHVPAPSPPPPPRPLDLVSLATEAAREAAELLREGLERDRRSVGTKSSATDMVTEMDHASEQLVVARILAARPDDGILAEEGSMREGTSGVRWVIDPLDGTTNYLYGHPGFAVSIAAEHLGAAVAGAVVDVARGECFTATAGGGAWRDGEPITVRSAGDLSRALVATGFSYDAERRVAQAAVLARVIPRIRDVRRGGAASLELCSVACGRLDAYYERGLAPWDLAAGALVAAEAGAVCTALDPAPDAGSILAATPGIAGALAELLRSAGAADA